MFNYTGLIGVPFEYGGRGPDKFDCYGLIMWLHKQKGIELPDYRSPSTQAHIAAIFGTEVLAWEEIKPQQGAVVLFRIGKLISHVGYMIDDIRMIHTSEQSGGVVIERVDAWKQRTVGYYRYVGR